VIKKQFPGCKNHILVSVLGGGGKKGCSGKNGEASMKEELLRGPGFKHTRDKTGPFAGMGARRMY